MVAVTSTEDPVLTGVVVLDRIQNIGMSLIGLKMAVLKMRQKPPHKTIYNTKI